MSVTDKRTVGDFSEIDKDSVSQDEGSTSKSELEFDKYGFSGGKEYTDPKSEKISVQTIRKREVKWLNMLDNWDKWMAKRFSQVKKRCRKGIPSSLRGRAWQLLCGSKRLLSQNEDVFQRCLKTDAAPQIIEDIEKDLHRQFPFHEMFSQRGGTGQTDLRDVLYAYANHNTRDGYCQAQAPVAAVLLMHMPAEEAFWCMVAMFDYYIPGYYSPGLEAVQMDGSVMQGLLRRVSPVAYKHLDKHNASPMLYCTEWFMCIFSRTLPWPSMLRLWDMFFCEGVKVIFGCGLVLLKISLGKSEIVKKLQGLYETLEYLKKFDMKIMRPEFLIRQIMELKIDEDELEKEHKRQYKLRRKQNSQTKQVKRVYRYIPTHTHKRDKDSETPVALKSKTKLNTVSVNTPHMIVQAIEHERVKKNEKKLKKAAPAKNGHKQKLDQPQQSVQLTDYKQDSASQNTVVPDLGETTLSAAKPNISLASSSGDFSHERSSQKRSKF